VLLAGAARASREARRLADHPLVGRAWDANAARFTTREAVAAASAQADLVLLGEVHDNPDHHRLQRELLEGLVRAGRRPAVAMEQFDRERQAALDRARAERPADPEHVAAAGGFDRRGWRWSFYEPLVELALAHGLPLVAANLSRAEGARIVELGPAALGAESVARLGLDRPWPAARTAALEAAVREGHCGQLPERVVPRMAQAQRARDAVMAELLLSRSSSGAVLIAGNGHVRRDLGVPTHLAALAPERTALSVGILEVEDGVDQPGDYVAPAAGDAPQFDFVLFTPRVERADPCLGLRIQ
jgi:uncharacterized iron-regulated protein